MSTEKTNIINIANLPAAKEISDGDLIIVQNKLGTQVVDWADVSVARVDDTGNVTIKGTLIAAGVQVSNATITALSATALYSGGKQGVTKAHDFYNKFTTVNGIVASAAYVVGSPEYEDLTTNVIPAATAAMADTFKKLYIGNTTVSIQPNTLSGISTFATVVPDTLTITDFAPSDFNIVNTTSWSLSSQPFVDFTSAITTVSNGILSILVNTRQNNTTGTTQDFYVKVIREYV